MNITIYINRQNEELFKEETEKSKLLNSLLANHYAQFRNMPNPRKDGLPPTVVVSPQRLEQGVCKIHGTPLTDNGKCLQKGCKYA